MPGLIIKGVVPESIAAEMELAPGDRVVSINGETVRDIIDYDFFIHDPELLLEIEKQNGETWEIELEKGEGESLGILFDAPIPTQCGNKCIFCFVHQLPKGLRAPLYVKDEDYRLSFLYGNYVTLANIGDEDLARIIDQRLSPLYISVHATEPALREQMLGRRGIRPILDVMRKLADARILMHTQVVLCPGVNDGAALERTVSELSGLYPAVSSLAIVPIGLTSHRHGLPSLNPVTSGYASSFVTLWEKKGLELADRLGAPFLFLSDEFYLKAGAPFPPLDSYGDLPQLENGVGMIPLFLAESEEVLDRAEPRPSVTVTVVTGESPYPYLQRFLAGLSCRTGVEFRPVAVTNRLFGESVTVTGLLAGRDIIHALEGKELGDVVLIPDVTLKEGEGIFLDDLTVSELEAALGKKVEVVPATPTGIYDAVRD